MWVNMIMYLYTILFIVFLVELVKVYDFKLITMIYSVIGLQFGVVLTLLTDTAYTM